MEVKWERGKSEGVSVVQRGRCCYFSFPLFLFFFFSQMNDQTAYPLTNR